MWLAQSVSHMIAVTLMEISVCALLTAGKNYRREVRVIPVDFTKGQKLYSGIEAEISDLDVAVLGE